MYKKLMSKNRFLAVVFTIVLTQLVTACVPVVVGTVAVTAINTIQDRRSLGRNIDDNSLELKLRSDFSADPILSDMVHLSVTIINGIVLLTGEIQHEDQRVRAKAIAESYPETRKVVDEMQQADFAGLGSRTNDSWITSKVKTVLLKTPGVPSSNIKVITERSRVYLLGLVTKYEADRAVEAAKTVRGVTHIYKVFEYIAP